MRGGRVGRGWRRRRRRADGPKPDRPSFRVPSVRAAEAGWDCRCSRATEQPCAAAQLPTHARGEVISTQQLRCHHPALRAEDLLGKPGVSSVASPRPIATASSRENGPAASENDEPGTDGCSAPPSPLVETYMPDHSQEMRGPRLPQALPATYAAARVVGLLPAGTSLPPARGSESAASGGSTSG
jgi:hypothetical protein